MLKVKPFLFILFLTVFSVIFVSGCSDTGSSSGSGGGIYDNSTNPDNPGEEPDKEKVTPIDLANDPFSLLGVYNITLYGTNGEPATKPTSTSQLRVGLNLATAQGGALAPEVLMSLEFEGKKIPFKKYVIRVPEDIVLEKLPKFISDTFTSLGAELIEGSSYELFFTLDPDTNNQYSPILNNNIVTNGEYLKLKLEKVQDIEMDKGLGEGGNTPTDPETPTDPIPVTGINITTDNKSYFKGSNVIIDFTLAPYNTSDIKVKWESSNNGNGEITAVNGKGSLKLENVQLNDTIIFITEKDQKAQYEITVTDTLTSISFSQKTYVLEQNQQQTISVENYEAIKVAIKSITYTANGSNNIRIDNPDTGQITALKNGVEKLTATATLIDGSQLTAECEIDVLGLVDFSSNDAFIASAQGTYEITFFGTNPGKADGLMGKQTEVPVTTDCELYKKLFGTSKCEGGGIVKNIIVDKSKFVGRATIKIENDGSSIIHTKILMTADAMVKNSPNDQYQYSVYKTTSGADSSNSEGTVAGIIGRHLTAEGRWDTSTFDVRQYMKNMSTEIILYSHLKGKQISIIGLDKTVNPITYVVMKKISSQVEKMDYSDILVAPFNKVTGVTPSDLGSDAPTY